ncbi:MAG: response regulator transcription factor [Solirubrobacterales bacterium]
MRGRVLVTEDDAIMRKQLIVVSGRTTEADRVLGLELGADDYLTKPVSPRELVARTKSVLRRTRPDPGDQLRFDGLVIDQAGRTVTVHDASVQLRPREFELLAFMAANDGRAFSREHLLRQVWGSGAGMQDSSTVTEHVRRIRQRLEPDPERPRWIHTVRGVGYAFRS